jgi:hypothetical protein
MKAKFCFLLTLLVAAIAAGAQTNTTAPKQAAKQADKQTDNQDRIASCLEASRTKDGKPLELTEDFSKAAVRALVAIGNNDGSYASKVRVDSALNDAEAAAQGCILSPDSSTLGFLQLFALNHKLRLEVTALKGGFPEYVIVKDANCVRVWKLALQKRKSGQPEECGAYDATEADK